MPHILRLGVWRDLVEYYSCSPVHDCYDNSDAIEVWDENIERVIGGLQYCPYLEKELTSSDLITPKKDIFDWLHYFCVGMWLPNEDISENKNA